MKYVHRNLLILEKSNVANNFWAIDTETAFPKSVRTKEAPTGT